MQKVILESSPLRSFVKGTTWETSGLVTVLLVAFLFTGDPVTALEVSLCYFPIRVIMYFGHERIWKRVRWGHTEHTVQSSKKRRS